jgi:hypothetical protein
MLGMITYFVRVKCVWIKITTSLSVWRKLPHVIGSKGCKVGIVMLGVAAAVPPSSQPIFSAPGVPPSSQPMLTAVPPTASRGMPTPLPAGIPAEALPPVIGTPYYPPLNDVSTPLPGSYNATPVPTPAASPAPMSIAMLIPATPGGEMPTDVPGPTTVVSTGPHTSPEIAPREDVPEPSSLVILAFGFVIIAACRRLC